MSSIAKTLLTLSAGAGIATSAMIAKKHPEVFDIMPVTHSQSVSPIILYQDGTVRFLGNIPPAAVVAEIQTAAKNHDAERLNAQLIKHRLYVIPENLASSTNR